MCVRYAGWQCFVTWKLLILAFVSEHVRGTWWLGLMISSRHNSFEEWMLSDMTQFNQISDVSWPSFTYKMTQYHSIVSMVPCHHLWTIMCWHRNCVMLWGSYSYQVSIVNERYLLICMQSILYWRIMLPGPKRQINLFRFMDWSVLYKILYSKHLDIISEEKLPYHRPIYNLL